MEREFPFNDLQNFWRKKEEEVEQEQQRFQHLLRLESSKNERKLQQREGLDKWQKLRGISIGPKSEPKELIPVDLPADAHELIQRAWDPDVNHDEVFVTGITRKDLLTLRPSIWLNDSVITFFLNLVVQRSAANPDLPKTYAFSTFFYTSLTQKGYGAVKRWTRRENIFSYDILLVPLHLHNNHWAMAVVDFGSKSINYYDSLGAEDDKCLLMLVDYLQQEAQDKQRGPFSASEWTMQCMQDIPQQQNCSDCGVFACKFADYASRRAEIDFKQAHMPYFRQRMVWEICQATLM